MTELDAVRERARRYEYADGIPELVAGVFLAGAGALLVGLRVLPPELRPVVAFGLPSVFLLTALLVLRPLVARLKSRYTHPRTGYAVARRRAPGPWAALAAAVGAGVGLLATTGLPRAVSAGERWLPLLAGAAVAAPLVGVALAARLGRLWPVAVGAVLLGGGLTLGGTAGRTGAGVVVVAVGIALAVGGARVLRARLRANPVAETPQ